MRKQIVPMTCGIAALMLAAAPAQGREDAPSRHVPVASAADFGAHDLASDATGRRTKAIAAAFGAQREFERLYAWEAWRLLPSLPAATSMALMGLGLAVVGAAARRGTIRRS